MNSLTSAILLAAGIRRNLRAISLMRCSSISISTPLYPYEVYYSLAGAVNVLLKKILTTNGKIGHNLAIVLILLGLSQLR